MHWKDSVRTIEQSPLSQSIAIKSMLDSTMTTGPNITTSNQLMKILI